MKAYLEIEMPKNCNGCPLHFYEGQGICSCCVLPTIEDDEILKPWKNKRKDCPLVPVPPHYDLIDHNALKIAVMNGDCETRIDFLKHTMDCINKAPVVIPSDMPTYEAEEGET